MRKFAAGAFDAGGDDAGGDDGSFEQSEVVFRKVENFPEAVDGGGGFEIDGGEADDGLVDDAEVGLNGRGCFGIAAVDTEVDRDVDHFGTFGEIHPEEKDVRPSTVGEVHADGGAFEKDGCGVFGGSEELRAEAQGVVGGMTHAEHPLVATDGADGFAHLVGEGLEGELVVGVGKSGGNGVARSFGLLGG